MVEVTIVAETKTVVGTKVAVQTKAVVVEETKAAGAVVAGLVEVDADAVVAENKDGGRGRGRVKRKREDENEDCPREGRACPTSHLPALYANTLDPDGSQLLLESEAREFEEDIKTAAHTLPFFCKYFTCNVCKSALTAS